VFARDIERMKASKRIIDDRFLSHIFVSSEICLKTLLHRYGGWGYHHILMHIVTMMLEEGMTRAQIDVILKDNPRTFLDTEGLQAG
jgi:phosphotriesterase-related protein